jgi:hypothetical protein
MQAVQGDGLVCHTGLDGFDSHRLLDSITGRAHGARVVRDRGLSGDHQGLVANVGFAADSYSVETKVRFLSNPRDMLLVAVSWSTRWSSKPGPKGSIPTTRSIAALAAWRGTFASLAQQAVAAVS